MELQGLKEFLDKNSQFSPSSLGVTRLVPVESLFALQYCCSAIEVLSRLSQFQLASKPAAKTSGIHASRWLQLSTSPAGAPEEIPQ